MQPLLLATTVLAPGVGTAAAQDQVYDWSGAYVRVQAGYGWGDHDRFTSIGTGPNVDVKGSSGRSSPPTAPWPGRKHQAAAGFLQPSC